MPHEPPFGAALRDRWLLDPTVTYLNHGTVGGKNLMTSYNHLTRFAVSSGQKVEKGKAAKAPAGDAPMKPGAADAPAGEKPAKPAKKKKAAAEPEGDPDLSPASKPKKK